MICDFLKIRNAATLCAAFFLLNICCTGSYAQELDHEGIRKKATDLLLQKKKSQALQLLLNQVKVETTPLKKEETSEFLIKIAQKFISRETQEAYENSINLTIENPKEAANSIDKCLAADPQQLECLIQRARLLLREKNTRGFLETQLKIKELVPLSRFDTWTDLLGQRNEPDFKNKAIIKNIPEKISEDHIGLILLELDRSFLAKNYARAKDLIAYFEKHYSPWPDLTYYKQKLNSESIEEKQKSGIDTNAEQMLLYANKCKSLNKSTARKFRYDFELCMRVL